MRTFSPKLRYWLAVAFLAVATIALAAILIAMVVTPRAADPPIAQAETGTGQVVDTEVEIQRRFNELRSELLDERSDSVGRWLAVTAILVTVFGVGIALFGILGFSKFQTEARLHVGEAEKSAGEARAHLEAIKDYRQQAEEYSRKIRGTTSRDFRDPSQPESMSPQSIDDQFASRAAEPDEIKRISEAVRATRSNPDVPILDRAIADALALQESGNILEATERWRTIANAAHGIDDSLAARAWFSVGYLLEGEQAIDAYDKAIALKPDYADAYNDRGIVKGSLGRHPDAIEDFDQAIRFNPNYAEAFNNRGVARGLLRLHAEAVADFDRAIGLNPEDARAYFNRGRAKAALDQYEDAIGDFDQSIRLNPNYPEAYNNRGAAKASLERYADAIHDFERAILLNPDNISAYFNRGGAKASLGDFEGTRSDLETALDLAGKAGNAGLKNAIEQQLRALDDAGKE